VTLKVAVTHDVDRIMKTYQYLTKSLRAIRGRNFTSLKYHVKSFISSKNSYWNFDELLKIEKDHNIKATYFFLNESMKFNAVSIENWSLSLGRYKIDDPQVISIIKRIHNLGHEIGMHGSYYSYKDFNLLKSEKKKLENILGESVVGIRQHHLNLNERTWEIQQKCDFMYDASWGFNDNMGYKNECYIPFSPNNQFIVFPMVLMDTTFCNHPQKWNEFNKILKVSKRENSILVLNWHTNNFNDDEFPNFKTDFIKILEILKNENAIFNTLREYCKMQSGRFTDQCEI
jgi:peptidoglycan/xylan/chitin deacetylase (PgdA/CDA1 family)